MKVLLYLNPRSRMVVQPMNCECGKCFFPEEQRIILCAVTDSQHLYNEAVILHLLQVWFSQKLLTVVMQCRQSQF